MAALRDYALDMLTLRYGKVEDGTMQFSKAHPVAANFNKPEDIAAG